MARCADPVSTGGRICRPHTARRKPADLPVRTDSFSSSSIRTAKHSASPSGSFLLRADEVIE
jgi:hypothetical protein